MTSVANLVSWNRVKMGLLVFFGRVFFIMVIHKFKEKIDNMILAILPLFVHFNGELAIYASNGSHSASAI